MPKIKRQLATFLLSFAVTIFTKLPITNFTSRLIDRLIVASEAK